MNDDLDIPTFLRRPLTPEIRARLDEIVKQPHLPSHGGDGVERVDFDKPKGMSQEEWAEVKTRRAQQKEARHKVHLSKSKLRKQERLAEAEAKREARAAVASGARWDAVNNRWITQEDMMPKLKITAYVSTETDGVSAPNSRAISSVNQDADRQTLVDKVIAIALRSGKRTTKIEITDPTGQLLETWKVNGDQVTAENGDKISLVAKHEEPDVPKAKTKSKSKSVSRKKLNGGPRVIDTIKKILSHDRGTSVDECADDLKKIFPDRKRESMLFTVKKQVYLWHKTKEHDEKRGFVFYGVRSEPRVKEK